MPTSLIGLFCLFLVVLEAGGSSFSPFNKAVVMALALTGLINGCLHHNVLRGQGRGLDKVPVTLGHYAPARGHNLTTALTISSMGAITPFEGDDGYVQLQKAGG